MTPIGQRQPCDGRASRAHRFLKATLLALIGDLLRSPGSPAVESGMTAFHLERAGVHRGG